MANLRFFNPAKDAKNFRYKRDFYEYLKKFKGRFKISFCNGSYWIVNFEEKEIAREKIIFQGKILTEKENLSVRNLLGDFQAHRNNTYQCSTCFRFFDHFYELEEHSDMTYQPPCQPPIEMF